MIRMLVATVCATMAVTTAAHAACDRTTWTPGAECWAEYHADNDDLPGGMSNPRAWNPPHTPAPASHARREKRRLGRFSIENAPEPGETDENEGVRRLSCGETRSMDAMYEQFAIYFGHAWNREQSPLTDVITLETGDGYARCQYTWNHVPIVAVLRVTDDGSKVVAGER